MVVSVSDSVRKCRGPRSYDIIPHADRRTRHTHSTRATSRFTPKAKRSHTAPCNRRILAIPYDMRLARRTLPIASHCMGPLCITSPVEPSTVDTFLLVAKEVLQWETCMRKAYLWARLLRFHRSLTLTPSVMARKGLKLKRKSPGLGPCAEWRTQQPSSGCLSMRAWTIMDRTLTAVRPSRWAWASGGHWGRRRGGMCYR